MTALAKLKDPSLAPLFIDNLRTPGWQGKARDALAAIGPPAEDAVLAKLRKSKDTFDHKACAEVLERIGTQQSLPVLEQLVSSRSQMTRTAAERAIETIRERQSQR